MGKRSSRSYSHATRMILMLLLSLLLLTSCANSSVSEISTQLALIEEQMSQNHEELKLQLEKLYLIDKTAFKLTKVKESEYIEVQINIDESQNQELVDITKLVAVSNDDDVIFIEYRTDKNVAKEFFTGLEFYMYRYKSMNLTISYKELVAGESFYYNGKFYKVTDIFQYLDIANIKDNKTSLYEIKLAFKRANPGKPVPIYEKEE